MKGHSLIAWMRRDSVVFSLFSFFYGVSSVWYSPRFWEEGTDDQENNKTHHKTVDETIDRWFLLLPYLSLLTSSRETQRLFLISWSTDYFILFLDSSI
jgi:hypothetical protein